MITAIKNLNIVNPLLLSYGVSQTVVRRGLGVCKYKQEGPPSHL